MTDRELLQLAAKAAGYQVVGKAHQVIAQGVSYHALVIRNERGGDSVFDPLDDDGDALRLAVKLGLFMRQAVKEIPRAEYEKDPYAATRRAIVRAAAAVGASQ